MLVSPWPSLKNQNRRINRRTTLRRGTIQPGATKHARTLLNSSYSASCTHALDMALDFFGPPASHDSAGRPFFSTSFPTRISPRAQARFSHSRFWNNCKQSACPKSRIRSSTLIAIVFHFSFTFRRSEKFVFSCGARVCCLAVEADLFWCLFCAAPNGVV